MKFHIIEDGNFSGWMRSTLVIGGVGAIILALDATRLLSAVRLFLFLIGFLLAGIGGYASKAHSLRNKPFDNSYRRARKTYETTGDSDGPNLNS
ncbi:hypothetical protein [Paraburkholderia sp.]|uniref:hypothetical protein n=1 Tax=Paraburkholderia sp. TaxID=1926495 RepID=UPI0025D4DC29|nr:hypothetical protein [Paraburkholderia sp.]